jgi:hypothetical protein
MTRHEGATELCTAGLLCSAVLDGAWLHANVYGVVHHMTIHIHKMLLHVSMTRTLNDNPWSSVGV